MVESSDPTMFQPGDLAFLRAHTGCYLDVQDEGPVKARWVDLGVWQGLELAKREPAPIRVGDTIYLKSHTGMYIDVQGDAVQDGERESKRTCFVSDVLVSVGCPA